MSNFIICARNVVGLGSKKKVWKRTVKHQLCGGADDATDFYTQMTGSRNEAVWLSKLTEGALKEGAGVYPWL